MSRDAPARSWRGSWPPTRSFRCARSSTRATGPRRHGDRRLPRGARRDHRLPRRRPRGALPLHPVAGAGDRARAPTSRRVRRIYAFQLLSLDRYLMSRGYSFLVRRLLQVASPTPRPATSSSAARRCCPLLDEIQRPGLVLGHRVHGPRRTPRARDRRDPRRLHQARRQDLHGAAGCATRCATSGSSCASAAKLRREAR